MTKIKKALFVVGTVILFGVALRSIQYDNRHAVVCSVNERMISFKTDSGHVYEWECSVNEHYEVGQSVTLVMFDYETVDVTDDIIVKVR